MWATKKEGLGRKEKTKARKEQRGGGRIIIFLHLRVFSGSRGSIRGSLIEKAL